MTKAASSFHPPWAVVAWVDGNNIFIEIPSKDGSAPYIWKESLTENGLGRALFLMRDARQKAKPAEIGSFNFLAIEGAKAIKRSRKDSPFTEEQRQAASAVLKKLGITGK